jgi:hypothetical protein
MRSLPALPKPVQLMVKWVPRAATPCAGTRRASWRTSAQAFAHRTLAALTCHVLPAARTVPQLSAAAPAPAAPTIPQTVMEARTAVKMIPDRALTLTPPHAVASITGPANGASLTVRICAGPDAHRAGDLPSVRGSPPRASARCRATRPDRSDRRRDRSRRDRLRRFGPPRPPCSASGFALHARQRGGTLSSGGSAFMCGEGGRRTIGVL